MVARKYDGQIPTINVTLKGMMLYFLIFPLLVATFFSLATGDVKKFTLNLIAYVIYFFGIKIAKKGFEEEKKYNSSKLSLAPKRRYKMLASMIIGGATFFSSLFCVENSLITSVVLALSSAIGFIFYYGLDPSVDKVDTTLSKVIQDAIEVIDEVKKRLNELEKINSKFYSKEIKESFNIIIDEVEELVKKIEDDPKILSKVRKFFKVYLSRIVEISSEFSKYSENEIDKDIEKRFVWLLKELKDTIIKQKNMLKKKDLVGLDIQIEALTKQLKNEGV
jgi:5-bromo-4-chloroindolyl phosphate hydrolysis protein